MKKILLLGDPVAHSFSPAMQNAAFRVLNLPFQYEALHIPREKFLTEIPKILSLPDLFGANITSPFKEKILPFVQPDLISTQLQAVNTIVRKEGRWFGYNTDLYGAESFLRDLPISTETKVLVLGKGGAARVVALAFKNLGVEPLILGRSDPEWDRVQSIAEQHQFIINATGSDDLPIQWDRIPLETIAIDLRYYPKPKFLKEAERFGHLTVPGLQMLLYQGSRSFEIWTGQPPPLDSMEVALMSGASGTFSLQDSQN